MNNRARVFSEIVSMDAWHDEIGPGRPSGVFVELAFREGKLGGDSDDFPFTFTLRLKRAELIVHVERPLKIVRRSIARSTPNIDVRRTASATSIQEGKARLAGSLGVRDAVPVGSASITAEATIDDSRTSTLEVTERPPAILVAGDPVDEGAYRWSLEPSYLAYLVGQPWQPVDERRLDVLGGPKISKAEPAIRAELVCRLEDLSVSDIVPKDETIAQRLMNVFQSDRRRKVAEHHIKHVLRSASLEAGEMDNRFAKLVLASIAAAVEKEGEFAKS